MTSIVISLVLLSISLALVLWSVHVQCKIMTNEREIIDLSEQAREEASNATQLLKQKNELIDRLNKSIVTRDFVMVHVCSPYVVEEDLNGYVVLRNSKIDLEGTEADCKICVKRFDYKFNDSEDRDFARREAEELAGILNEK